MTAGNYKLFLLEAEFLWESGLANNSERQIKYRYIVFFYKFDTDLTLRQDKTIKLIKIGMCKDNKVELSTVLRSLMFVSFFQFTVLGSGSE